MKKLWFITLVQILSIGVLMSAELKELGYQNRQVPIIYEQSSIPMVSMQLIFTGAGHLANTKDGLADMSAKLLSDGTKSDGSIGFATKLDAKAIELGAYVGRESFIVELSSLSSEFDTALGYLLELLQDPNFTKDAYERVRLKKEGWLEQKKSDFDYIAGNNLRQMLFSGTALGKPYMGTEQSIKEITLKDIEQFIQTKLGFNNLIVVIGGKLSFDVASKAVGQVLATLPKVKVDEVKTLNVSNKQETQKLDYDTEQAYIYFGGPLKFSYSDKEQHLVKIAEFVLGGSGFGSRIMEEIRVKRGLAYSAYASLRLTKSASYLSGYLQTKLASQDEAIKIVKEVVANFVKEGITAKELEETKKFLLGSEPLRTETLSQRLGRAFNDYYYERPLNFSSEQLKKIETTTLTQINSFIQKHSELNELSFSVVTKK